MFRNESTASPCADFVEAVRKVSPPAVLVRIFPDSRAVTHLFGSKFCRLYVGHPAEEKVKRLIKRSFGNVADWRLAHDFYVPAGALYLTPEPWQNGYVPEDDRSFGLATKRLIAICNGNVR